MVQSGPAKCLALFPSDLKAVLETAEAAYPQESCGFLIGKRDCKGTVSVNRVITAQNVAEQKFNCFEIDSQQHFALIRELDNTPEYIVGHYHSHPDRPARPSEVDLSMAFEPEFVWLIVSVIEGHALPPAAFTLSSNSHYFHHITLHIKDFNNSKIS